VTEDLHSPTTAGPTPEAEPATTAMPTPGAPGPAGAGWSPPASGPSGLAAIAERPEAQLGGAFAGGVLVAILLRRFARV
jgi:hypothetical protein